MRKRTKLLQMRLTEIEHGYITAAAKRAGKTVTAFLVGLAYGEASERSKVGDPLPPEAIERYREGVPAGNDLASLKARFGLKTAAQVGDGEAAAPPDVHADRPQAVAKRRFNFHRPQWYNPVDRGDWWELVEDVSTGQVFVVASGNPREFDSVDEARAFISSRE